MTTNDSFPLVYIIREFVKTNHADIDKSLGLSYLCNDENLYRSSTINFLNSSDELYSELEKYYNDTNLIEAEKIIHRIKGYSYYIGSQLLYDFSSFLCYKIKNSELKELEKSKKSLIKDIKLFMDYFKIVISFKKRELENV